MYVVMLRWVGNVSKDTLIGHTTSEQEAKDFCKMKNNNLSGYGYYMFENVDELGKVIENEQRL